MIVTYDPDDESWSLIATDGDELALNTTSTAAMFQMALGRPHKRGFGQESYHELWDAAAEARKMMAHDAEIETPTTLDAIIAAPGALRTAGTLWSVEHSEETAEMWMSVLAHIRDLCAQSDYDTAIRTGEPTFPLFDRDEKVRIEVAPRPDAREVE